MKQKVEGLAIFYHHKSHKLNKFGLKQTYGRAGAPDVSSLDHLCIYIELPGIRTKIRSLQHN